MDISILKSQTASEYAALLANPDFLKVIKSSTGSQGNSNSSLLATLEKLSSLLTSSGASSSTSSASSSQQLLQNLSSTDATKSSQFLDESQSQLDDLIKHADMLQEMLNLEMDPPEMGIEDLFEKLRGIISKLDSDTRQIHRDAESKKPKEVYQLRGSNNTQDGFDHSITILV